MIKLGRIEMSEHNTVGQETICILYTVDKLGKDTRKWIDRWSDVLDECQEGTGEKLLRMSKQYYSHTNGWTGRQLFFFDGGIDAFERAAGRIKSLVAHVNLQVQNEIERQARLQKQVDDRLAVISWD